MKKYVLFITILVVSFSSISTVYAKDPLKKSNYTELTLNKNITPIFNVQNLAQPLLANQEKKILLQKKSQILIEDEKQILQKSDGNDVLIHNNGAPIRTNIISNEPLGTTMMTDSQNQDIPDISSHNHTINKDPAKENKLFAIYFGESSGIEYESYIFANQASMRDTDIASNLNTLKRTMDSEIEKNPIQRAGVKPIYRNINLIENHWGGKAVSISSTIAFIKRASNIDVDGKKSSVWDVACQATQVESFNKSHVVSQYTWLNTNQPNQILFSWGPVGSTSEGTHSVSIGVPLSTQWNYSFKTTGFARKDMTSKSGKYGKWRFYTSNYNKSSLTTKPAIRISNSKGDLIIKVRHQATVTRLLSTRQSYTCDAGAQTFTFPDR